MTPAEFSIRRPVFAWMLMFSFLIFGWLSFRSLGVSDNPDIDMPFVNIRVSMEGASPEVMESDVVDVIENAMMGVEGLKDMSSTARYGRADVNLEFFLNRNIDVAIQDVQSRLSRVVRNLPRDVEPPVVSKTNPEDQPILWVGVAAEMPVRDLMAYVRNNLVPQFQLVAGVGDVFIGGYLEPNIRIWVDLRKLRSLELTVDDLVKALDREHIEYPAGTLEHGEKEFNLRVMGEASTAEEIGNLAITTRGGAVNFRSIRLKDVARIEEGTEDIRRVSRILGERSVGIGIRKQRNTNAVEVAHAVRAKMEELRPSLPESMEIGVNFDGTRFIEQNIAELKMELILAALLTSFVCFLFLGSLTSTMNILLAIPTSLIGAFIAIYAFGFTLNTFTLLALILAVGIVVDDAIMVLENIVRHRQMGKSKAVAARDGTNQVTFAAIATTMAIVSIFLPVAFMDGIVGKYFFQFAVTITFAVMISSIEALTITPMRCAQFLTLANEDRFMNRLMKKLAVYYGKALGWALNYRLVILGVSFMIFLASTYLVQILRKEFVPSQDQGMLMVRMQTPVGSSLEYTDEKIKLVEEVIMSVPEIERYIAIVGGFTGAVNSGMMFVTLSDQDQRERSQQEIITALRGQLGPIEGIRSVVMDRSTSTFGARRGFPIEFSVRGPNWEKLVEASELIKEELGKDPRFVDVDSNYEEGMPEVKIYPDRERALARGVSIDDIGSAVSFLVGGSQVGRFNEDGRRIDVRVRLEDEFRTSPQSILNLFVRNNRGELVRLSDVTHLEEETALLSITREQRERSIGVYSNIADGESQGELVDHVESLQELLPPGYRVVLSGSTRAFADSFASLITVLILGIIVAYMILGAQFNSFLHPVVILLALPFSMTGAWLALYFGGLSLNVFSMVGLILLMGIVMKNSIMLVDFTNQMRAQGLAVKEALLEAGPIRLRPIVMTSITVISASIPSALGLGPGSETRVPMSIAVIGGVIVATFFTLFVIPVAYSLLAKLESKYKPELE